MQGPAKHRGHTLTGHQEAGKPDASQETPTEQHINLRVGGEIVSPHQIEMKLTSTQNDQYVTIRDSVVDAIPSYSASASRKDVKAILSCRTLNLADPDYTSGDPVDVLLSNTHSNWTMMDGTVLSPDKCYRAQNTIFGWIIGGDGGVEPPTATCLQLTAVQETPEKLMKTIWELDQAPYYEEFNSLEDLQAKEDFQDSHSRLPSGRYVVTLPRRKPAVESRSLAMKRYHQNEKTLLCRNQLAAYTQVVQEYLDLDHAEVVSKDELCRAPGKCYYFPMFGVSKLDSTTTKLMAVCDASAPTSTGYSLNDSLLSGPSLHPMLLSVITRFRRHRLCVVGDVSKMFREVALRKDEYDFHRFLHRGDNRNILDCRMKRLTLGETSSPYLASQILHQMAQDHGAEHPKAAQLMAKSFYVDDVLTGADNIKDAIQLRQELNQLLAKGCMILRK